MNTVVIFSVLAFITACDLKSKTKIKSSVLRIGVQSDLLAFDPFSFQALGERKITELLYDRLLYFEEDQLKSDLDIEVSLENQAVLIQGLKKKDMEQVESIFIRGKSSALWKEVFKPFSIKKSKRQNEEIRITYSDDKNFISNLKTLAPLVLLKGEKHGAYRVGGFQKGIRLRLVANKKWIKNESRSEVVIIKKIKSISDGLKQISQGEIDVFAPSHPTKKGDLESYENLKIVFSKRKNQKLRLFSKFGEASPLEALFCSHKKEIQKTLSSTWKLSRDKCSSENLKKVEPSNLKVVLASSYGAGALDLLARVYKVESGKQLKYDILGSLELSRRLKNGGFDHYLSLDVESEVLPVLFDSFHSKGRYNSFKITDSRLDSILEKAAKAKTIKGFSMFESQARSRLNAVLPFVFEYSRPQIEYIFHEKTKLKIFKSPKTLMNFKK